MQISQQLNPVKIARGYIVNQSFDWSQVNATLQIPWTNQGAAKAMKELVGCYIDNSQNTNSVKLQISFTNQTITVYGGEVVTLPLFSATYPTVTVTNNNDVTPGVGYTTMIFTDFDLGFNIAQTGTGAAIQVSDAILEAASQANGVANPVSTKAIAIQSAQFSNGGTHTQFTTVAGGNLLRGSGLIRGWMVTLVSVTGNAYLCLTNAAGSSTAGILMPLGGTICGASLGNINYTGNLSVYTATAGAVVNLCTY